MDKELFSLAVQLTARKYNIEGATFDEKFKKIYKKLVKIKGDIK